MRLLRSNIFFFAVLLALAAGLVAWLAPQQARIVSAAFQSENGDQWLPVEGPPYTLPALKPREHLYLYLDLRYTPGQNATFVHETWACLARDFEINGAKAQWPLGQPILLEINYVSPTLESQWGCARKVAFDFAPYLHEGINTLRIELWNPNPRQQKEFYIGSVLLGAHLPSTLLCGALILLGALCIWRITQAAGWPRLCSAMAIGSALYWLIRLHTAPDTTDTSDFLGHLEYLRHMSGFANPFDFKGYEAFQSPLYYFIAGQLYALGAHWPFSNPLTLVRLFSLFCYLVFAFYGVQTLRQVVRARGIAEYVGTGLILFWPLSFFIATNINNDLGLYAVWSTAFYYLVRWRQRYEAQDMAICLGLIGVCFMMKTSAIVPASIAGICIVAALFKRKPPLYWWNQGALTPGYALLTLGLIVNAGRIIYWRFAHDANVAPEAIGELSPYLFPWQHFLSFDAVKYLLSPFILHGAHLRNLPFFDYFLRSALYGEYAFPDIGIGLFTNLFLLLYVVAGIGLAGWQVARGGAYRLLPQLAGVAVSLLAVMAYARISGLAYNQDFRYVLPMLVPFATLYAKGIENAIAAGYDWLYLPAICIGIALPVSGVLFYLAPYVI